MADILSPKQMSHRMKAKGLQKLKHYCQSCNKQCRDENGFKCHTMSEAHLRQMEIFGQNPDKFIQGYSMEFETAFLEVMKRCHGSKTRVAARVVYNEYISNRHHVHMNATRWTTLTEFVMYLGKSGKCKVEDTEKGWFITYNNATDSEGLFERRRRDKRLRSKLVEEKNQEKQIEKQIDGAFISAAAAKEVAMSEGGASNCSKLGENKTRIAFALAARRGREENYSKLGVFEEEEEDASEMARTKVKRNRVIAANNASSSSSSSVLDELMMEEEAAGNCKEDARKPYWLCQGIIVKVKKEGIGYYNKKGIVTKVLGKYYGEIEMLDDDTNEPLRLHQDDLETVIPCIGGAVRIVNGSYRGFNARLLALDTRNFCAKVQLDKCCVVYGGGRVLPQLPYDHICKLNC